jgi:nitroreductase
MTKRTTTATAFDEGLLDEVFMRAVRAPSIHNSQPWHWQVGPRGIDLYTDATRRLPRTDPDGRDQVMSCGAALHHLLVALADTGQGARVRRLPDRTRPFHLATVEPAASIDVDVDAALAVAIDRRRTDRRPFRAWPVPPELSGELAAIADRSGVGLSMITDPRMRHLLFRSIEEAARTQDTDPRYLAELASWSGRPPGARDGVPADRGPTAGAVPGRMPMRTFPGAVRTGVPGVEEPGREAGEPESAVLLLLATATDTALQWLLVGELTSALLLRATLMGLAGSPLTQPLEVSGTRTFVRDHVTDGAYPQMLLRLGWPSGKSLPPTPRLPLKEVVTR